MLVMGVDSAAQLADSIMVVSYYHTEQKIATLSIPRDFYVTGGYRINAVFPFAEQQNPGSGPQAMADFVSQELDIPIHYWLMVNFEGVEQIVDAVGGIEINVETPFVDYEFPTRNYSGYMRPAPSFEKGPQKMDGERALIYARSRHGTNGTGSDFDRARRQAEVGEALLQRVKDKFDSGEIFNINSINALIGSARGNVKTSAQINEIMSAYEIFKEVAAEQDSVFDSY
jgi:LCP family protein required for cell wall assembly